MNFTLTKLQKIIIVIGIFFLALVIWGIVVGHKQAKKFEAEKTTAVAADGTATSVAAPQQPSGWFLPFWIGWMMGGGGETKINTYNTYSDSSSPTATQAPDNSGTWGTDPTPSSDSGNSLWDSSNDSGSWGSDDSSSSSSWDSGSDSGSWGSDSGSSSWGSSSESSGSWGSD